MVLAPRRAVSHSKRARLAMPRPTSRRPSARPWQPWKSFGVMLGAMLGGIAMVIVGMTAEVEQQLPSVELDAGGPVAHVAIRVSSPDQDSSEPVVTTAELLPKRFAK
jgi:hypothetical protein